MESLSSLGLILEAPESILAQTPFAQFDQLSEQLQGETGGAAVRLGLYRAANGDKATIRLVCASQQLPEGVRALVASARREGAQIRDKLQQTLGGLDLGEVADYDLLPSGPSGMRRPRSSEAAAAVSTAKQPTRPSRPAPVVERAAAPVSSISADAADAKTASSAPPPSAKKRAPERPAVEAIAAPPTPASTPAAPASAPPAAERPQAERPAAAASASGAAAPSGGAERELPLWRTSTPMINSSGTTGRRTATCAERVRERLESDSSPTTPRCATTWFAP
jgi:hypothetical protein